MIRVKRNSGHVVGDKVVIKEEVLTRLERSSELSRMDARGGRHIVGANLDVLCIVVSCEPLPPPGFIDRAIVSARAAHLRPVLIVNKSDLPCSADYLAAIESVYKKSLKIFTMSAEHGTGLEPLVTFFSEGHRGVFVGPTGVGKSSILNALLPKINLTTGEISETKKRGRNTTTVSTLHLLSDGGELIDSPGFNDFGLVDISAEQLSTYFPGFEEAGRQACRFRDCKHREEPECRVIELVDQGGIDTARYTIYLQMLTEVEALQIEPDYRERRHRRKKT
ncbi:ribosome small subunit-dependent GTPase A [Desulfopila sp. IMCC35006]|nr:ribosome small subunit-dependent GTPase A [Desulfopila sp. IMCC35006]